MLVVDASAILEVLLLTPAGQTIEDRIFSTTETLHAPHLFDLEVAQVLRRYCANGDMTPERGYQALSDLTNFPITRYPHDLFLPRIWELCHNVTAYDAVYIALAESLSAPLLTRDARLASAPGHQSKIELV